MTILHQESCHGIGDVEVSTGNTFNTPEAIITFHDDKEVATTATKIGNNKTIFKVGRKVGPNQIDPCSDDVATELSKVSAQEFCEAASGVIDQFANVPTVGSEARVAAEADYERVIEAAFRRVRAGSLTSEEAGLVWQVFDSRTRSFTGVPYSGTESYLDLPDPVGRPSEARISLPA